MRHKINSMTKAKELIDWFWSEYESAQESLIPLYPESHGLCQCSTENLIWVSADPDRMRAFFMIGVTIDQMMYTHYCVSGDHPSRVVRRKSLAEREIFNPLFSSDGYGSHDGPAGYVSHDGLTIPI